MIDFPLIVLAAIVANLLTPTVRYLWRCTARSIRRNYIWLDSTQQLIGKRRYWRKTGDLRKYMHRFIEIVASNVLDIDYIEWREAITKNNARLFRKNLRITRWERHSQANIEECFVNPSYSQFLELMMDEDTAKVFAENKPMGDAFRKGLEKVEQEQKKYKRKFDEHIEFIDNKERYESVLYWGILSKQPPYIAATVYEEKALSFPEDYHIPVAGFRSYDMEHIYRFVNEKFPERHNQ